MKTAIGAGGYHFWHVPRPDRRARALLSLDGLSVGDAFGQCFFSIGTDKYAWQQRIENREPPRVKWIWTDDTEMALAIVEVLDRHGEIDQDDLAATFARRYARDDRRGYGGMAHRILTEIGGGRPWRDVSSEVFDGGGSFGNGGAMRAAPLGAHFADTDTSTIIEQARRSAQVTHFHPEGQAGAIAVALAAAWAVMNPRSGDGRAMLEHVLNLTPAGQVHAGVERAMGLLLEADTLRVAGTVGNGSRVSAVDTVPFCLWSAARNLESFEDAMWTTVSAGGDIDTNCAIVGGIVALSAGRESIPQAWLAAREALQFQSD